ncbi:MAG: hypothetical protein WA908_04280, partial [Pontixanthobacter sp.]
MTRDITGRPAQTLIRSAGRPLTKTMLSGLMLAMLATTPVPAMAQSSEDEVRIRKLEAEVRALQRKVFPGGDGRFFEPQITGSTAAPTTSGAASTTAVTDILVRLDALETQIASLTAQTEVNANAVTQLTARIEMLEARPNISSGPARVPVELANGTPAVSTPQVAAPATAASAPEAATPTPARLAAVSQIAKPQTDDAGDDEYSYGFRLWDAGFFPEAQQQLTMFVEDYPNHYRTTFGRNLLGRAYLDAGQPSDAAPWFLKNYQANAQDARAPDSLLYLAETMIALDDS